MAMPGEIHYIKLKRIPYLLSSFSNNLLFKNLFLVVGMIIPPIMMVKLEKNFLKKHPKLAAPVQVKDTPPLTKLCFM